MRHPEPGCHVLSDRSRSEWETGGYRVVHKQFRHEASLVRLSFLQHSSLNEGTSPSLLPIMLAVNTGAALVAATFASPSAYPVSFAAPSNSANYLIFHIDVLLLCVAACFVLLAMPRIVVKVMQPSVWTGGLLFRFSDAHDRLSGPNSWTTPSPHLEASWSAQRYTAGNAPTDKPRRPRTNRSQAQAITTFAAYRHGRRTPVHMPSWSTMFPLVSSYLNIVIRPGHSVGSLLLLTLYAAVMLYAGLAGSNPFASYNQAGMLSTSQIPVAILMATKSSVMGALAGRGYEKLNFLHRFAGRVTVLAANVHALGYIYQWTLDGSFIAHVSPSIAWGIAALVCVDILFFFSISIVREVLHHTFYISHVVSAIILMAATCKHIPVAIPYVLAAVGFYAFDLVVRLIRTRVASANLCTIPELSMIRIQVPGIDSGWHAGQHLRIKVLSPAMGWFGWAESHPFTIASASKNVDGEGLVLMCKKAGDWTNKLFDLAACAEFCEATGPGMNIRVVIDGPYGGHGHTIVSSFSGALLVTGGSGITYALSTVQELLRDAMMGSSRVRNVKLVWSVPDPTSIVPLLPMFIGMLERAQTTYTKLEISTFFTQAPTSEDIFDPFHRLPSGLSLSPGRPRISRILGYVVDLTCEAQKESGYRSSGVFVGTCGPLSLVEEVGSTVRTFPTAKAKTVGGIECHKEIFAW